MFDRVIIAEKPDVASAIAGILPGTPDRKKGYIQVGNTAVTWCFGHMIELAEPHDYGEQYRKWDDQYLPIIPVSFQWRPISTGSKEHQLQTIGWLLGQTGEVVHAADAGREGQLIVDLVLHHFKYSGRTKRLWLNATDDVSVKRALASMKDNQEYAALHDAAISRAILDWVVGMNLSRAVTNAVRRGKSTMTVPIGRVQTATLYLIVLRELEIRNFKPVKYYFPELLVKVAGGTFTARWVPDRRNGVDENGRLLDRAEASRILELAKDQPGKICKLENDEKRVAPPHPFMLGTLQAATAKKHGWTADRTLDVAQSLYEKHKLISYPRTECPYLPESQFLEGKEILSRIAHVFPPLAKLCEQANPALRSPAWNQAEVDKDEHHGIIPKRGRRETAFGDLSADEALLFEMIATHYIVQFYPYYVYSRTITEAAFGGQRFAATGYMIIDEGWRRAIAGEDEEDKKTTLPPLVLQEDCTAQGAKIQDKVTSPPPRYNDGTLVEAMSKVHLVLPKLAEAGDPMASNQALVTRLKETAGLGTAATRHEAIKSLVESKLSKQDKKGVHTPSDQAMALMEVLPFNIKSPCLTAYIEQELDAVRRGQRQAEEFMETQYRWVAKLVNELKAQTITLPIQKGLLCPECRKAELVKRVRKSDKKPFWSCSGYPECKGAFDDVRGRPDFSNLKVPI